MNKINELRKEIAIKEAELKKELAKEIQDGTIRPLSDYTTVEKEAVFDKLYDKAKTNLDKLIADKYQNDDEEHYAWEELMKLLAKDERKFWDYYNSLPS